MKKFGNGFLICILILALFLPSVSVSADGDFYKKLERSFEPETYKIIRDNESKVTQSTWPSVAKGANYNSFVRGLGGVFATYSGPVQAQNAGQLYDVSEYVAGLMSIWGFAYNSGKYCDWGGNYDFGSGQHGGWDQNFDQVLSTKDDHAATDCVRGARLLFDKAGLSGGEGQLPKNFNWDGSTLEPGSKGVAKVMDGGGSVSEPLYVGDLVRYGNHIETIIKVEPNGDAYVRNFGSDFIKHGASMRKIVENGRFLRGGIKSIVRPSVNANGDTLDQSWDKKKFKEEEEMEVGLQKVSDSSMYAVSTALTTYVNNVMGVNGNDRHMGSLLESPRSVGNAGAYIGYGDVDQGFTSFITTSLTYGSSGSSYRSWMNVGEDVAGKKNLSYLYARYGRTLTDSGLDNTQTKLGRMFNPTALLGGSILMVYSLSEMIPKVFWLAFVCLRWMNPFTLFGAVTVLPENLRSSFPDPPKFLGDALQPVIKFASSIYDAVYNMAWQSVVPLFILAMVVSVLLMRKSFSSSLAMLCKRFFCIVFLVPFCACLYTGALDKMGDLTASKTAGTQMVASTLVDFGAWAQNNQLAVGNGTYQAYIESAPKDQSDTTGGGSGSVTALMVDGGTASSKMLMKLRQSAANLNQMNDSVLDGNVGSVSDTISGSVSANLWDKGGSDGGGFYGLSAMKQDTKVPTHIVQMLTRYITAEFYGPTEWESYYNSKIKLENKGHLGHNSSTSAATVNRNTIYDMYDSTNEFNDWINRTYDDNEVIWKGASVGGDEEPLAWASQKFSIFKNGKLNVTSYEPNSMIRYTGSSPGLSPISMYNYLSSTFDKNSIVVYSATDSLSERSKQMHTSVNMVGTGLLQWAFGLNVFIVLGVLTIIAFVYSWGLFFNNLKRGVSMITSIPFAVVGVTKSVAQVASITVAMIMELLGISFMYMFVCELMVVVSTFMERTTGDVIGVSTTLPILLSHWNTAISTRDMIFFTVMIESLCCILFAAGFLAYRRALVRLHEAVWNRIYGLFVLPSVEEAIRTGHREKVGFDCRDWLADVGHCLFPVPA